MALLSGDSPFSLKDPVLVRRAFELVAQNAYGDLYSKVVDSLIDGEVPLKRVFTVLTTNRLDIFDPALIHSKHLKVMEVSDAMSADDIQAKPLRLLDYHDEMYAGCLSIQSTDDYPLTYSHLQSAEIEISNSPVQKGKVQLDEFLEAELSQEPQVGFIIGVGANDISGVLLPIATSLTCRTTHQKVWVTGAVSSATSAGAQMDMAVQMTQQSAQEALTMVKITSRG